jgi:hypothetical protein
MDFIRSEVLSADQFTLTDLVAVVGAPASNFDADSDLQVSANGAVLIPKKPIENYEWLEFEIESSAFNVDIFQILCFANNYGIGAQRVIMSDSLLGLSVLKWKIPNIGRIERIEMSINTIDPPAAFITVKNIRVIQKNQQRVLTYSPGTVIPDLVDGVGGWHFESSSQRWYVDLVDPSQVVAFSLNSVVEGLTDTINVKIDAQGLDACQCIYFVAEGDYLHAVNFQGQSIEIDFGYETEWPRLINIGGNGLFAGRIYVTLRYGNFPEEVNVFGKNVIPSPVSANPFPTNPILNRDNVWTGANTFQGNVTVNGGFTLGALNGFLKAVAGVVGTSAILAADIVGAGNIITHNINEFCQVGNNLSDLTNAATARANLGLGTMATQNANAINVTGGQIAGTSFSGVLGNSGQVLATGEVGIRSGAATDTSLGIGAPSSVSGAAQQGIFQVLLADAAATGRVSATITVISSAAVAYTLTEVSHFNAFQTLKGIGSTITNVYGFKANSALVQGTNNYGFWTDINSGASNYGIYAVGSAYNALGTGGDGSLVVGYTSGAPAQWANVMFYQRHLGDSYGTGVTATGYYNQLRFAAAVTTAGNGVVVDVLQNNAVTLTTLIGVKSILAKGAGTTVTNAYGFYCDTLPVVGTQASAFYSNVNQATGTFQFFADGTGESRFDGSVQIFGAGTSQLFCAGLTGTHANTGVTIYGYQADVTSPATNTSNFYLNRSVGRTTNSAYTLEFSCSLLRRNRQSKVLRTR